MATVIETPWAFDAVRLPNQRKEDEDYCGCNDDTSSCSSASAITLKTSNVVPKSPVTLEPPRDIPQQALQLATAIERAWDRVAPDIPLRTREAEIQRMREWGEDGKSFRGFVVGFLGLGHIQDQELRRQAQESIPVVDDLNHRNHAFDYLLQRFRRRSGGQRPGHARGYEFLSSASSSTESAPLFGTEHADRGESHAGAGQDMEAAAALGGLDLNPSRHDQEASDPTVLSGIHDQGSFEYSTNTESGQVSDLDSAGSVGNDAPVDPASGDDGAPVDPNQGLGRKRTRVTSAGTGGDNQLASNNPNDEDNEEHPATKKHKSG